MSSASQPPLDTIATALRSLQLTNARLENENHQLSRQNVELQAETCELTKRVLKGFKTVKVKTSKAKQPGSSGSTGAGNAGSSPADTRDTDCDDSKEMNPFQCGKYFICAGEIWVHPSPTVLFASPLEKPEMAHDDPNCYDIESPELTLMGAQADLYHLVPEKLHGLMGSHILFQSEFKRRMKEGHSTFVSALRKQMPSLCQLDVNIFNVEHPERRQQPQVEKYLKFDLNDDMYPIAPPILFPDLDDADPDTMFRNKILITALGILLRGSMFMRSSKRGTPGTNCKLWGVSTITGPMIASTATIVIHLLSPGENFSENNNIVDLYSYHQYFKEVLVNGRDLPHFQETLRMYQEDIFGSATRPSEHIPSNAPRTHASSAAKDFLRCMQAKLPPAPSAAPVPSPVCNAHHRMVPHKAASSSDSSSSDSDERSSGTESGSESELAAVAATVRKDQEEGEEDEDEDKDKDKDKDEDKDEDKEVEIIDFDEEVGGTDYDEVYINPVSAPTSAGRASSAHSGYHSVPPTPFLALAPAPAPHVPPPVPRCPAPVPVRRPMASSHPVASSHPIPSTPPASHHLVYGEAATTVPAQDKRKKRAKQTNATDVAGGNILPPEPTTETAVGGDVAGVRTRLRERQPPPPPDIQPEDDVKAEKKKVKAKAKDRATTKSAAKLKKVMDNE